MKRLVLFSLVLILASQLVFAANLDVKVLNEKPVILVESDDSAEFTLSIKNLGPSDNFEIYSLVGVSIFPKDFFVINSGSTKELKIEVVPHEETRNDFRGLYAFEYQIKGQQTGFYTNKLSIKLVELKDALDVSVQNINLGDSEATIVVKNLEDYTFEDIVVSSKTDFFEFSKTLNLAPFETVIITAPIDKDVSSLKAGEYENLIGIKYNEKESSKISSLKYVEKGEVTSRSYITGFVVREKTIIKKNEGNVETLAVVSDKKDILSRLFTTFSQKPTSSDRGGVLVNYAWEKELAPGEELQVVSKTNYTFPFALILIVAFGILITRVSLKKDLTLNKTVSHVRTKGGEFALKVRLGIKSSKPVKNVKIIDRIPYSTKLYENFGNRPDSVNENTKSVSWNVPELNAGEERFFTYVIYSNLNVIGKFELPSATAIFEQDGKMGNAVSNKAYFAAEDSE